MQLRTGLSLRRTPDGIAFYTVHYSAHPDRGPEWVKREQPKYNKSMWDREQEIIYEAGAGKRIFAEVLSRWEDKILIDPADGIQIPSQWKRVGGFDHGKANPTAALLGCIDHDGVLYILSEYYQPGLSPKEHLPNLESLTGFLSAEVAADPSIFARTQAQSGGSYKSIVDLYREVGIQNLFEARDNAEATGMERILDHWLNLDNREPTLKIVCPRHLRDIQKPIYGVHNEGCPNLLWELRRARYRESSATQLANSNPTEAVVDKDNHLRDCLKYMVFSFTDPSEKTPEQIVSEALKDIPLDDATSRMIRGQDALLKAKQASHAPMVPMGRRGRYNLRRYEAMQRRRHGLIMGNLFRDPGDKG
jgi:hypothetical protein